MGRVNVYAKRTFLRWHKNHFWILCHGIYTKDLGYFFAFGPVKNPQNIEKKFKKIFFGFLYRSKYLIFGHKEFLKNFGLGTWYLQKTIY
jgi:hypothetical protein